MTNTPLSPLPSVPPMAGFPPLPGAFPGAPFAAPLQPAPQPPPRPIEFRLAEDPADTEGWVIRGKVLNRPGLRGMAADSSRRALLLDPGQGAAWAERALALSHCGRHAEALHAIRRALALVPADPDALFRLTVALQRRGDFPACREVLERLIRLQPELPSHRWGRAQIRLHEGEYEEGFADYECRYWLDEYQLQAYRPHPGPRWTGEPLDGRIVMITTEQGFGDTIMMARYLPLLKGLGARRVVVERADELCRLFAGMEGVDAFVPRDVAPTPIYHVHSSIMSLPHRFGTTAATVPPPARLTVPEEARAKAARLLGPRDGRLRVGIVWSGNQGFSDNHIRAAGLERFLPLLSVPGTVFHSLQKGPPEAELQALPDAPITALGPEMQDFADTAAVLEALDLVIMTDSSVAHLAGSLGVPVWNLVQHVPYWVYGRTGPTTPWYPSMRLYRQGPDEDWTPVFEAVRGDLERMAAGR